MTTHFTVIWLQTQSHFYLKACSKVWRRYIWEICKWNERETTQCTILQLVLSLFIPSLGICRYIFYLVGLLYIPCSECKLKVDHCEERGDELFHFKSRKTYSPYWLEKCSLAIFWKLFQQIANLERFPYWY